MLNFEASEYWDTAASHRLLYGLIRSANEYARRDGYAESVMLALNHSSSNFNYLINCVDDFVQEQIASPVDTDDVELLISQNPYEYLGIFK